MFHRQDREVVVSTRILIADDHPIFRQGLVTAIQESDRYELVGQAENGTNALALLESLRPAIAILDIGMPAMDGLEVIRRANRAGFEGQFVVLTMYKEEEYFRESMDLGVRGYLLKESASDELVHCLEAVSAGRFFVSPYFSDYLLLRPKPAGEPGGLQGSLDKLSPTERRILRMIAENKTSKEIADALDLSFRTVQNHRMHMCEKLKLEGHNRLLQFALEHKSLLA